MKENRRKYEKLEEDGKEWKGMHAQLRAPFRVRLCPLFNLMRSGARGGGHNNNRSALPATNLVELVDQSKK